MKKYTSDIAFTPAVKALQERHNSRSAYARMEESGSWSSEVTPDLQEFLSRVDSFYLSTASNKGQPYIQHRGGKKGFLKVLDKNKLAFADFRGNKQFISSGNLSENDKAFIFLMDYPNRARIKIWGRAEVVFDDQEFIESLHDDYNAIPERGIVFTIEAWDINCPQHITPRYNEEDIQEKVEALKKKVEYLELELLNYKNEI